MTTEGGNRRHVNLIGKSPKKVLDISFSEPAGDACAYRRRVAWGPLATKGKGGSRYFHGGSPTKEIRSTVLEW